jgi:hypothetical protein
MTPEIQSPAKELRFTRSGQAVGYWIAAAICGSVAVTLLACAVYRDINPELPHQAWALLPVTLAFFLIRQAMRMTRHAYLILTPLGIEVFPFFKPTDGMRLITWQEISSADVTADLKRLTLHYDQAKSSGIHLSLMPIRKDRRSLLAKAVSVRVSPTGPPTN